MKKQLNYLRPLMCAGLIALSIGTFSCKKKSDSAEVSKPADEPTQTITCDGAKGGDLSGNITGTLCSGSTYNVTGDITIPIGSELVIQPGVTINFPSASTYNFIVRGNLYSLGNQSNPVRFTVNSITKTDGTITDPLLDPTYNAGQCHWTGIIGDTSCKYMVLKWTKVEFGGAALASTSPAVGLKGGDKSYLVYFNNPKGDFILEDSWIYGGSDDPLRISGGRVHIMRNTFEKGGFLGGECLNMKSGAVGNIAYNLFIGSATNGPKASNKGTLPGSPQTNINSYNNTILNGGYRRSAAGRGGSINYEEGARGMAYNNITVNCKYGLRIVNTFNYSGNSLIIADTAHVSFGNNLNYVDSIAQANQIYPINCLTIPQLTDITDPRTFLPGGYFIKGAQSGTLGGSYDGTNAIGKNNPMFVKYTLPQPSGRFQDISWAKGFDFHLQAGSPAIGKGYTSFTAASVYTTSGLTPFTADPNSRYLPSKINEPNIDLGAFPTDGSGNKHIY